MRIYKLRKMRSLSSMNNPITMKEWLSLVGRQRFETETGRSAQLVSRAVSEGLMPPGWYKTTRDWCVRNNFDVPDHLFKWTEPKGGSLPTKQNANC